MTKPKTHPLRTMGGRIRKRRLELGLSRESLALLAHVSEKSVYYWETGSYPTVDKLAAIARALKVSIYYLLGAWCPKCRHAPGVSKIGGQPSPFE